MNKILCLVDFTDTSLKAMDQAVAVAKWKGASITVCHIVSTEAQLGDDLIKNLSSYELLAEKEGVIADSITGRGSLFKEVERISNDLKPDLVVLGTHGKSGLVQNLFGSNIYRLVQKIKTACLVVSDYTQTVHGGFKQVLMPVAPHDDYLVKVQQTANLLSEDGVIHIFEIRKAGTAYDEKVAANAEAAQAYLTNKGINCDYIEKGSRDMTDGFSHETLDFASENKMDLLSIMTQVSEQNKKFGKSDKENALLNKISLPVLACHG